MTNEEVAVLFLVGGLLVYGIAIAVGLKLLVWVLGGLARFIGLK